ncbi:MAG: TetR family transcriptional regulator [Thermoanaerobaculia bacterium]|nr:TetR family transcriptional regulator [Thermoanaerobaculia bacterium]
MHDSAATREALVLAATDLFAEHGFDGVSVDQIAARSGVNKALINYHFGGKAGLYAEILHLVFGSMSDGLRAIRESNAPPDARLREVIREIGRMVVAHPGLPQMILREVLSGGEHIDDSTLPHFLGLFGTVRSIVEAGMDSGDFRRVNPFATHLGLVGSLMFFFSTERFRKAKIASLPVGTDMPLADDYLSHVEELMVRGLAAEPRRARTRR